MIPVCPVQENALLQDLSLRCLWVAKVHHLVQQFIYYNEVVSYTLLFEFFEILSEDLNDLVEEEKNLGRICVAFREGEEVEIVVTDVEILLLAQQMHRDI
jgi:hypothetical protein